MRPSITEKFQTRIPSKDVIINDKDFLLYYEMPFGIFLPGSLAKHYANGKTGELVREINDTGEVYHYVIDGKVYAKASQGREFHLISEKETEKFETPIPTHPIEYCGEEFIPIFKAKRAHKKTGEQPIFNVKSSRDIEVLEGIDNICYYDENLIIGFNYNTGMLVNAHTKQIYEVSSKEEFDSLRSATVFEDQLYGVTRKGVVLNLDSGSIIAEYDPEKRMNKITRVNGELAVISHSEFAYPLEQNSKVYSEKYEHLMYILNLKPNIKQDEISKSKELITGVQLSLARNPFKKSWARGELGVWEENSSFIDSETTYGVSRYGGIYNFRTGKCFEMKDPSLYNICGIPSVFIDGCLKSVDSGIKIAELPSDRYPNAHFLDNEGLKVHFETWDEKKTIETHHMMDLTSRLR